MRHQDAHHQLDDAVHHAELALRNLSDRLEDLMPGNRHRRRLARAGRAIGRTTSSVLERVPGQAGALLADTRQGVSNHPVRAAFTAMFAGLAVWSLLRLLGNRPPAPRLERRIRMRPDRDRATQQESALRH